MLTTFLLTLGVFVVAMLAFAVGLFIRGRCFTGKCNDHDVLSEDGSAHVCGVCGRTRELEEEQPAD